MLRDSLIESIDRNGPMPFEDFMEACLYDPVAGFFSTGPLRSTATGDFLTSPEISPWFGRIIGRYVQSVRDAVGRERFTVVEVGCGSGSLMRALREELGDDVDYWAVEVSPAARESVGEIVGRNRVATRLDEVPGPIRGVVIGNELVDNLPAALVVNTDSGWEERWLGASDGGLCLVSAPVRPEVGEWADRFAGSVPVGGMVEVQLAAYRWIEHAVSSLDQGSVLIIDYGGTTEELEPRRTRGTLRTYRAHHLGPDPLDEPGETDLTMDVHFSALAEAAARRGATVTIERQDDFLAKWGLRDVVSQLRYEELDAARRGDAMKRLALRSDRTDAETLLHPRGLGDFRVMTAAVGLAAGDDFGTQSRQETSQGHDT